MEVEGGGLWLVVGLEIASLLVLFVFFDLYSDVEKFGWGELMGGGGCIWIIVSALVLF